MLRFWQSLKLQNQAAIQVETGLNRLGFREHDLAGLSKAECKSFCLVMSHLA